MLFFCVIASLSNVLERLDLLLYERALQAHIADLLADSDMSRCYTSRTSEFLDQDWYCLMVSLMLTVGAHMPLFLGVLKPKLNSLNEMCETWGLSLEQIQGTTLALATDL